jgi:hypothetical protein
MNWGLSSKALYTIYRGAILPLIIYGVPVWNKALEMECNRKIYNPLQRIINIKIAKAYRTKSNEAFCKRLNTNSNKGRGRGKNI